MNLKELRSFKMSDAIALHDELNPALFRNDTMIPQVRETLLEIAADFIEHLGISRFDIEDITVSGSNAAYSYTPHSDIDLHIAVDMNKLSNDEIYRELFSAKKTVYNDTHDIKIRGYDVELYVQDSSEPHVSLGDYSVLRNQWNKHPVKRRENLDTSATKLKFEKLANLVDLALQSDDLVRVENVLDTIKKYRKAGLDQHGEFGPENLAFKALRSQNVIKQLYDLRNKLHSDAFSISETKKTKEDYDPNSTPPGPEFKPTMPAGTVKVDVSDVYDWYKLGQHISNLKGLGKHDFGQGPPSTIFSFGSEEQEHKYINDLAKTGLTTTDIDPLDPHQPKGMKKQKTDPTYNVNEALHFLKQGQLRGSYTDAQLRALGFMLVKGQWAIDKNKYQQLVSSGKLNESASGYIPSEAEKNDPRFKTALTVDIKPNTMQQNAKKLGSKISRSGIPPLLRA